MCAPCNSAAQALGLVSLIAVVGALVASGADQPTVEGKTDDSLQCSQVPQLPNVGYIATAKRGANYHKLGSAIAAYANQKHNFQLRSCITAGSNENLQLLRDTKHIVFALVQLDALHYHAVHNPAGGGAGPIRVVAYLYGEKVHLFVRNHLYLNSPADLAVDIRNSRKVWLGPKRSERLYHRVQGSSGRWRYRTRHRAPGGSS